MFLPVMLVGLLAGSAVGVIVGLVSPLIAFALTGMPTGMMLPLVIVELVAVGLVAGLVATRGLRTAGSAVTRGLSVAWGTVAVVAAAPVALLAARLAVGLFSGTAAAQSAGAWWTQVAAGVPGLVLQVVAVGIALVLIGRRR